MIDDIFVNLFIKMDEFYSKSSSLSFTQIFHGFDLVVHSNKEKKNENPPSFATTLDSFTVYTKNG